MDRYRSDRNEVVAEGRRRPSPSFRLVRSWALFLLVMGGVGVRWVYDLSGGAQRWSAKSSVRWSWVGVVSVSMRRVWGRPPVEG